MTLCGALPGVRIINWEPMDDKLDEALAQMREAIERDVAAGYDDPKEIVESAVDVFADDLDFQRAAAAAVQMCREALAAHHGAQAEWPVVTDCDRLDCAFDELERNGVVSRQNFSCCGTCGAREIWDEMEERFNAGHPVRGYTFFHVQDTESATEGYGLCLNYGSVDEGEAPALGIAQEVVDSLRRHGLTVHWDGTWSKRIEVELDWKRRRPLEAS